MTQTKTSEKSSQKAAPKKRDADARAIALRTLELVLVKGDTLDEAWDKTPALKDLSPRDRSFCRLLSLETLRYLGFLDTRLKVHTPRLDDTPLPALLAMRLGAAQLLLLGTPAHAAISTSVDLVPPQNKHVRGVVNAVLRRIAAEGSIKDKSDIDAQSCIPPWMIKIWQTDYGNEAAKKIAAAVLVEAPLDISVKENAATWAEKLGAEMLPTGSLRLKNHVADVTQLAGFEEGAWWVQDAAAALPVRLAGDVKGKRVFDVCAAPGGKTAQLAAAGAQVVAVDHSQGRLRRLRENLERLKLKAEIVESDVFKFNPAEKADVVLLDPPCSASGTMRRHPDLMHRKGANDVSRLAELQRKMLAHAAALVKPGGILIFAVCSLQKEEGEKNGEQFLKENPLFTRIPIKPQETGNMPDMVTKDGDLRTLPYHLGHQGGMDGFYAMRLMRKAD